MPSDLQVPQRSRRGANVQNRIKLKWVNAANTNTLTQESGSEKAHSCETEGGSATDDEQETQNDPVPLNVLQDNDSVAREDDTSSTSENDSLSEDSGSANLSSGSASSSDSEVSSSDVSSSDSDTANGEGGRHPALMDNIKLF